VDGAANEAGQGQQAQAPAPAQPRKAEAAAKAAGKPAGKGESFFSRIGRKLRSLVGG